MEKFSRYKVISVFGIKRRISTSYLHNGTSLGIVYGDINFFRKITGKAGKSRKPFFIYVLRLVDNYASNFENLYWNM